MNSWMNFSTVLCCAKFLFVRVADFIKTGNHRRIKSLYFVTFVCVVCAQFVCPALKGSRELLSFQFLIQLQLQLQFNTLTPHKSSQTKSKRKYIIAFVGLVILPLLIGLSILNSGQTSSESDLFLTITKSVSIGLPILGLSYPTISSYMFSILLFRNEVMRCGRWLNVFYFHGGSWLVACWMWCGNGGTNTGIIAMGSWLIADLFGGDQAVVAIGSLICCCCILFPFGIVVPIVFYSPFR